MLAMLLAWSPQYARVARGQVLSLRNRDFVTAVCARGMSELRVLLRYLLANSVAHALEPTTMEFGTAFDLRVRSRQERKCAERNRCRSPALHGCTLGLRCCANPAAATCAQIVANQA